MKPIPEIKILPGGAIENWREFFQWAAYNHPLFNAIHKKCAVNGLSEDVFWKVLAYNLICQNAAMMETMMLRAMENPVMLYHPPT